MRPGLDYLKKAAKLPVPEGMDPRTWLAGQALAGLLANPNSRLGTYWDHANNARRAADTLLHELARTEGRAK